MRLRKLLARTALGAADAGAVPRVWTRAALTVAVVLALCTVGRAQDRSAPPIAVEGCTMSANASEPNMVGSMPPPAMASGLVIVATNQWAVAATEVDFRVRYNGRTLKLVDRGSFAPHEKLSRSFTKFSVTFAGSSAACSVAAVVFADGSRWDAIDGAASPAPTASP